MLPSCTCDKYGVLASFPRGKLAIPPVLATSTACSRRPLAGSFASLVYLWQVQRYLLRSLSGSLTSLTYLMQVHDTCCDPEREARLPGSTCRKYGVLAAIPREKLGFPGVVVASMPVLMASDLGKPGFPEALVASPGVFAATARRNLFNELIQESSPPHLLPAKAAPRSTPDSPTAC